MRCVARVCQSATTRSAARWRRHQGGGEMLEGIVRPRNGLGVAVVATCMAAFAASSAFAATSVKPDTIKTTSSGGCGTLPAIAPNDPSGLVPKLGKQYHTAYQGLDQYPIVK